MEEVLDSKGVACIKLQPKDCQDILGITFKTFAKDAQKGAWQVETGPRGAKFYYVPKAYYEYRKKGSYGVSNGVNGNTASTPLESVQDVSGSGLETVKAYQTAIDALTRENDALKGQIETLKNERSNMTAQIIKYKEREDLVEQLAKRMLEKPWWKFWG